MSRPLCCVESGVFGNSWMDGAASCLWPARGGGALSIRAFVPRSHAGFRFNMPKPSLSGIGRAALRRVTQLFRSTRRPKGARTPHQVNGEPDLTVASDPSTGRPFVLAFAGPLAPFKPSPMGVAAANLLVRPTSPSALLPPYPGRLASAGPIPAVPPRSPVVVGYCFAPPSPPVKVKGANGEPVLIPKLQLPIRRHPSPGGTSR